MKPCEYCEGTGIVNYNCGFCSGSGEGAADGSRCQFCKGTGSDKSECEKCGGKGEVEDEGPDESTDQGD